MKYVLTVLAMCLVGGCGMKRTCELCKEPLPGGYNKTTKRCPQCFNRYGIYGRPQPHLRWTRSPKQTEMSPKQAEDNNKAAIDRIKDAVAAGAMTKEKGEEYIAKYNAEYQYYLYTVKARSEDKAVKSESEWKSEQESKNNSAKVPVGWTFLGGGKDLANWKGQSTENVLNVFGNPPDQAKPWGQGGGAWTYNNLNITDAKGNPHKSVTFFVQNGAVVGVGLPSTQER